MKRIKEMFLQLKKKRIKDKKLRNSETMDFWYSDQCEIKRSNEIKAKN